MKQRETNTAQLQDVSRKSRTNHNKPREAPGDDRTKSPDTAVCPAEAHWRPRFGFARLLPFGALKRMARTQTIPDTMPPGQRLVENNQAGQAPGSSRQLA